MRKLSLCLIVILYVSAGLNHFLNPHFYEAIMPDYIRYHSFFIYVSGACEILLGLLLIPQTTRKIAAAFIIFMLTIFLWLHVQMLIDYWRSNNSHLWLAVIRIPLQFVLIGWAYVFTKDK